MSARSGVNVSMTRWKMDVMELAFISFHLRDTRTMRVSDVPRVR